MADRPILFSAPMVRALLYGRKTQTRRVLKPQPVEPISPLLSFNRGIAEFSLGPNCKKENGDLIFWRIPRPGDRLWVREALDMGLAAGFPICTCTYAADGAPVDLSPAPFWAGDQKRNIVPSIHMPRWASRITLIVKAVKLERLQAISETDAVAEGCMADGESRAWGVYAVDQFENLWKSLHGDDAWEDNPWVMAIKFSVVKAHIDMLRRAE